MGEAGNKADRAFLTNYALALIAIRRDPEIRMSSLADQLGIAERSAHRLIADLVADGYITKVRTGRRNRYEMSPRGDLRHPMLEGRDLADLIRALA